MRETSLRPLALRAHPLVFGVVIFLSSELMFFAGLFAAYFDLRSQSVTWPPADVHLNLLESGMGTVLLAISSVAMVFLTRALSRKDTGAAKRWLAAAISLGVVFLGIALHGWSKNGFSIGTHAYGSVFYAMTGFHALHVLVGVGLLSALFFGLQSGAFRDTHRAGAEAITYYWHFVFVVWLGIWGAIYLIR